jgi:hypothetical protein
LAGSADPLLDRLLADRERSLGLGLGDRGRHSATSAHRLISRNLTFLGRYDNGLLLLILATRVFMDALLSRLSRLVVGRWAESSAAH